MSSDTPHRHVTIEQEGRVVAEAEVQHLDTPGTVQAEVHVESGHMAPGTRSRIVDEVLDDPDVREAERFKAVLPRGDAEVLERVRERLDDVSTHSAGASVVVEGRNIHGEGNAHSEASTDTGADTGD
jgi:hypothetical protein